MTALLPWHHIHLTHQDREEVALWYASHLGARRGKGTPRSENLWYGNNLVQVQSDTSIKPPTSGEFGHIGLGAPNPTETLKTAVDAGATQVDENLITDPWGTPIQLVESEVTEFHHLLVLCTDPDESSAWYATHIGGEIVTCPWNDNYQAIRYDTMWLLFGQAESAEAVLKPTRSVCHGGWYTPNIDETVSRMEAAGCKFPVPIMPFGAVRLAFAEDPSGLWIELLEMPGGEITK